MANSMSSLDPDALRAMRAELRDLNDDYVAALDAVDLEAWADLLTPDCLYRVVSRENHEEGLPLSTMECRGGAMVRDRIAALRETAVFEPRQLRHFVSGVRITAVEEGRISAQANFLIAESLSDREPHLFMAGRYVDEVVRDDQGRLKFRQRMCIYDNWRVRTSIVYPM